MDTRALGATNISVTRIGLGLAAIGRPGYINLGREADLGSDRTVDTMRDRAHRLLDEAWAAGVRYLDAARSYGLAESFLATWLEGRAIGREAVVVGSKWGYTYTADWVVGADVNEVKDHTLPTFRRQLVQSRSLLGPWLRLYQIHSATLESGVLRDAAVLAALAEQRHAGLAIGLSVSGPRQGETIRSALEVRVDGICPFDTVQATWNVLETSAGPALLEAHAAGLGVIVKEVLANGRLVVDAQATEPDPASARAHAALDRIAGGRTALGTGRLAVGRDAVAMAAVLAQPWADVALSGAVAPGQLRSNIAALDLELGTDELDELAALATPAGDYWRERSALDWR